MKKRMVALFCLFCFGASILYLRLSVLATSQDLAQTAQQQSSKTLVVSKARGQIYDCNFLPIVNQQTEYRAAVLPRPENFDAVLKAVDPKERENVLKLLQKEEPFVVPVNTPVISAKGVEVFTVPVRYQDEQIAAHLIGHLDGDGKGAMGIEAAYDDLLQRYVSQTTVTYTLAGNGRELKGAQTQIHALPANSGGVVLTIDRRLQEVVEQAGKDLKRGAIVMLEPQTGKIKAAASFPAFSPNQVAASLNDQENAPMINRAFCAYNVGSTFKISTAATALEAGVSPSFSYTCTGVINVKGQRFKCHDLRGHGTLDMPNAMSVSCNPYFIDLGLTLDPKRMVQQASDLSFGKGYELAPGLRSQAGTLPGVSDLANPADIANFSFGQGLLTATPLQVGLMVCSVVSEGKTPRPILVEGETSDGATLKNKPSPAYLQAMSKSTAARIKQFLVDAVMVRDGQNAKPNTVSAGGKTGTAQTGQFDENGVERLQAWFAGFFPAETPRYVVVVLAEDGDYGNTTASPIFREIADQVTALGL